MTENIVFSGSFTVAKETRKFRMLDKVMCVLKHPHILFFIQIFFWLWAKCQARRRQKQMHLLRFANDSREICVGNRWVTLFPPCCLPEISIHPCCWEAYYPPALFPFVRRLCRDINLPQEENTGSPATALWSTWLMQCKIGERWRVKTVISCK